jgi:hypothetical protein
VRRSGAFAGECAIDDGWEHDAGSAPSAGIYLRSSRRPTLGAQRGVAWLGAALLLVGPLRAAKSQLPDSVAKKDSVVPRPDSTRRIDSVRAPIRLCAGGDVTLGTNLDTAWARVAAKKLRADFQLSSEPDSLLLPLRPLLSDADVVLINVEGAIGAGRVPSKCGKKALNCFAFRQPPATAEALRRLSDTGVVVGNVANNHARDAGDDGFLRSVSLLANAGVFVTGADTVATPVVTRRGDTIAVLGFYTSSESPDARDLAAVRRHVQRAVDRWGTVIVTMHLGAEGAGAQRTADSTEIFLGAIDRGNPVAFATAALESGATMVIGHGPHVLRAAEWRDDQLVLYSLGNLLTYGPFRLAEPMNRGVVVCAEIDSARHVRTAWLRPTMQLAPGVIRYDTTGRAATLIDSLSTLDFPVSGVSVDRNGFLRRRVSADSVNARALPASPPSSGDQPSTGSERHRARP